MEIIRIEKTNVKEYEPLLETLIGDRYAESGLEGLECFVLENEETIEVAGLIAVDISSPLPMIELIYVMPHYRYMGNGTSLLNAAEVAMSINGAEGIGAMIYMGRGSETNEFDYPGAYVKEFFEKRGYLLLPMEDEEIDESIELTYASKNI